jgi:hypothetical protein
MYPLLLLDIKYVLELLIVFIVIRPGSYQIDVFIPVTFKTYTYMMVI